MAELTFSVPLPLYYKNRQGAGISEASWMNAGAQKDLEASKFKAASEIRDNLAMIHAAERIMQLYRQCPYPQVKAGHRCCPGIFSRRDGWRHPWPWPS